MTPPTDLARGDVGWVAFAPAVGDEKRGTRTALVISADEYLDSVRGLVVVLPVTSVGRGWPHHVPITGATSGLPRRSLAVTEQPRTVSSSRNTRSAGQADQADRWLCDFLGT